MKRRKCGFVVLAAGLAALILAAPVQAGAIRFDNPPGPDHFVWYGHASGFSLEITSDAASQTGVPTDTAFSQVNGTAFSNYVNAPAAGGDALQVDDEGYQLFLMGVDEGTPIPSGLPWRQTICYIDVVEYGYPSFLPEGVPTYLGAQLTLGDGMHYGWIGVVMEHRPDSSSPETLDAFAWGYETTPDTPIIAGIPEPGTLTLLALGAAALSFRRRGC
jgi:hypothetical protein